MVIQMSEAICLIQGITLGEGPSIYALTLRALC
jgi:hypothetical protein